MDGYYRGIVWLAGPGEHPRLTFSAWPSAGSSHPPMGSTTKLSILQGSQESRGWLAGSGSRRREALGVLSRADASGDFMQILCWGARLFQLSPLL